MRREMTNYQLMLLRDDINAQTNQSPAFAFFNDQKIKNFFSRNAMSLALLRNKTAEIKKQYCLVDESGEPLIKEVDGRKELVYPSQEANDLCKEELTEFLNRLVSVEL